MEGSKKKVKKRTFNIDMKFEEKFQSIVEEAKNFNRDYTMTDLYHEIFELYLEKREQANNKIIDILEQAPSIDKAKKESFALGFVTGVAITALTTLIKSLF